MDEHRQRIARRVRLARWMNGQTQEELARRVGVSHAQVQKYETGENRVPSDRLCQIAAALAVSPAWLLQVGEDAPCDRETAELVAVFARLPAPARAMVRSLVGLLDSQVQAANGHPPDNFDFRDPVGW